MKEQHAKAIRARLNNALRNLYHNATPNHPDISERIWDTYENQFQFQAENEISYIEKDKLGLTDACWAKAVKLGFSHNERYYWLVQRITEFGQLYTYGRGGRTLAPSQLVRSTGNRVRILTDNDLDYMSWKQIVDTIQILEAFNTHVENWNSKENLTALWQDYIDSNCPGCENPPTEKIWQTPLELMCSSCAELLSPLEV